MIPVTRPYFPDRTRLQERIDSIYESRWLTSNGPMVRELEERLREQLGVDHLLLVGNGTLALQIALRALGVSGSALTSSFTFVATASAMAWEVVRPRFVDIRSDDLCLDAASVERVLDEETVGAIAPVHVYGNACDAAFAELGERFDVPVLYDAAHAFGVESEHGGLLAHGDAAILSFHATKLFHTAEGGAIVFIQSRPSE